jgi:hypothetical protein
MSDLPTIPKAEHASHYTMAEFIKELARTIGLTITSSGGQESDVLHIFTILEAPNFPVVNDRGYVFSLFVWKLSKDQSRHLEYVFTRDQYVTIRDHMAGDKPPKIITTWRAGIVSLIEDVTLTLEHIRMATAECATRAQQIKALYDTSSAPFLKQTKPVIL